MRILLLNEYYPPDTSATANMASLVAQTLGERHEVTVLAGRPSYDPSEYHPLYLSRTDARGPVRVRRVGSTAFSRRRMTGRVSNYLSYVSLALPVALATPADLIMAMTDPPIEGLLGAWVARRRRLPFVYNIRDLYPDMAVGGRIVGSGRWVDWWERMHRRAMRQAARVIVLGDDMRRRLAAKGVDPARIVVVRDGALLNEPPVSNGHPTIPLIRAGFQFVALHAGNLGFYGAWETLVEAARQLENEGFGLVFVGSGAQQKKIECAASGARAVRFLPFRPSEEIPYVLAAADVHIITVRRGLEGVVVPSKLYGILAAGRPVLAVAPQSSDVARIVTEAGCGLVADPEDPASVAAAIRQLRAQPGELAAMGGRARDKAREFERSGQLRLLLETVEQAGRC
ncbi:MAG TPA: glycosyltransferase family 4 protein [Candidatus Acidoferrales bacterium]|nr:glycosyltransferase family 4 protein [Candidatus Acidoferrales bacterium]